MLDETKASLDHSLPPLNGASALQQDLPDSKARGVRFAPELGEQSSDASLIAPTFVKSPNSLKPQVGMRSHVSAPDLAAHAEITYKSYNMRKKFGGYLASSRDNMLSRMADRLVGIDVLEVFDVDGAGLIYADVLSRSLKRFDHLIFTDENIKELLGERIYDNTGQFALKDLLGPFWRILCRRIFELQGMVALRDREYDEIVKQLRPLEAEFNKRGGEMFKQKRAVEDLEINLIQKEQQLAGVCEKGHAEAQKRVQASETILRALWPWLCRANKGKAGKLEKLIGQVKTNCEQHWQSELDIRRIEGQLALDIRNAASDVSACVARIASMEFDLKQKRQHLLGEGGGQLINEDIANGEKAMMQEEVNREEASARVAGLKRQLDKHIEITNSNSTRVDAKTKKLEAELAQLVASIDSELVKSSSGREQLAKELEEMHKRYELQESNAKISAGRIAELEEQVQKSNARADASSATSASRISELEAHIQKQRASFESSSNMLNARIAELEEKAKLDANRMVELEHGLQEQRANANASSQRVAELNAKAKIAADRIVELEQQLLELRNHAKASASTAAARVAELDAKAKIAAERILELEQQLQEQRGLVETHINASTARAAEFDAKAKIAADRIMELEQRLQEQRAHAEESAKASATRVSELNANAQAAAKRIQQIEQQLQEAGTIEKASAARISEMDKSAQMAAYRIAELEGQLQEQLAIGETSANASASRAEQLETKARIAVNRAAELEGQLQEQRALAETNASASAARISELEAESKKASNRIAELEGLLQEQRHLLETNADTSAARIAELEAESKLASNKIADLENLLQEQRDLLESNANAAARDLEANAKMAADRIDQLQGEIDNYRALLETNATESAMRVAELEAKYNEESFLVSKLEKQLDEEQARAEADATESATRIAKLEQDLEEQSASLESHASQSATRIAELQEQLRKESALVDESAAALAREKASFETELARKEGDIDQLRDGNAALESELAQKVRDVAKCEEDNQAVTRRLEDTIAKVKDSEDMAKQCRDERDEAILLSKEAAAREQEANTLSREAIEAMTKSQDEVKVIWGQFSDVTSFAAESKEKAAVNIKDLEDELAAMRAQLQALGDELTRALAAKERKIAARIAMERAAAEFPEKFGLSNTWRTNHVQELEAACKRCEEAGVSAVEVQVYKATLQKEHRKRKAREGLERISRPPVVEQEQAQAVVKEGSMAGLSKEEMELARREWLREECKNIAREKIKHYSGTLKDEVLSVTATWKNPALDEALNALPSISSAGLMPEEIKLFEDALESHKKKREAREGLEKCCRNKVHKDRLQEAMKKAHVVGLLNTEIHLAQAASLAKSGKV